MQVSATWCRLVQLGAGWSNLVHVGATWCNLVQFGPTWNRLVQLGAGWRVSKSSLKINLALRSDRAPVLVLLRFRFFLKPPMRSFRILVMENLQFLRNYNMF